MTNQEIQLKKIQPEDNQAIYKLIRETLEDLNLDQPGTAYTDPYLDHLYEFYQEEARAEYWILKKNEQVIGGIGLGPFGNNKKVAELQKYYIKKEFQGQGYGRLLFEKVLNAAKEMDYEKLYLETNDLLDQANRIYKHYGFELLNEPLPGSEHEAMNRWFLLELV